jgi:hypothetical protein
MRSSSTQQRVTISFSQWEAKVIPCANWWVTSKMKVMGCNLQFDNQLGCWDTHNSQLCNKEQALVGGLYHVSIPWVSLQGVHLAKSTFPVSCLPLQAGNITKMFEITRGTLQHALATKFARQANQFCCHVEHQIKCCLYTREGNNRSCKIEIVQHHERSVECAESNEWMDGATVWHSEDPWIFIGKLSA